MRKSHWALLASLLSLPACASAQPVSRLTVVRPQTQHGGTVVQTRWLQASPMQTRVVTGANGESWVGVWIDAPTTVVETTRAPVDVALVVDTSGSMAGSKIENARTAAASFISSLANGDIVSLYSFSDGVTELAPPTTISPGSRGVLLERVRALVPTGGTNLFDGLRMGTVAAAQAPSSHPVRRVVVISDGRANVGPSSAQALGDVAASATENGTQVTAIGVGLDYDESTLGALAVRSAGRLYHLEEPSQMASILHGELELLGQTVAANAYLELDPEDGVMLEGTDNLRVDRQGNRLRIPLGSLYAGQHREVLLRTRIPTTALGARTLGNARLVFDDPADHNRSRTESAPIAVEVVADAGAARASANERVVAMVATHEAANSQMRAAQMVNRGQMAEADAELQRGEARLRQTAREYNFSDSRVQGNLMRQAAGMGSGRAAVQRAASAPSPVSRRAASLQNSSDAMHSYGY